MSFVLVKPGNDIHHVKPKDVILSDSYSVPKINTKANPAHAGIIRLDWSSGVGRLGSPTPYVLDSFPHEFDYIPTVFATYKYDDGSTQIEGTLPFQYGALGLITMSSDIKNINLEYYSYDVFDPPSTVGPFIMQIRYYVMVEHG